MSNFTKAELELVMIHLSIGAYDAMEESGFPLGNELRSAITAVDEAIPPMKAPDPDSRDARIERNTNTQQNAASALRKLLALYVEAAE